MLQLNPERLSHIAGPGYTLLLTVKDRAAATCRALWELDG